MKTVIVMQGISGAGKTLYVTSYYPEAVVVSANNYFTDTFQNYRFDRRFIQHSHNQCLSHFNSALEHGKELVIVDNTNTTIDEIEAYAKLALEAAGYRVEVHTILEDPEVAHARNIHSVPLHAVMNQHQKLESSLKHMRQSWHHSFVCV